MEQDEKNFNLEYQYIASQDAEERLAEAYDLILELVLKEILALPQDGERCSTPSE